MLRDILSPRDLLAGYEVVKRSLYSPLESWSSVGFTLNEATFGLLGASFDPKRDIRDLSGRVILITGGNTGLGKETVAQLARHNPSRIYLAARNETKASAAIASIQAQLSSTVDIRYLPLDLASFTSIRAAAEKFTSESDRLDLLILNAGTMANPATTTEEGFEIQFGTNHVGHFLLTKLLLPTLQRTVAADSAAADNTPSDVRIVAVASVASQAAPPLETMTSTEALLAVSTWTRYAASKAANIMFASELARRYPDILSVSVHPGVVASELYETAKSQSARAEVGIKAAMGLFFRSVRTGALTQLYVAGMPRERLTNGAYYIPIGQMSRCNRFVSDVDMAKALWEWTEQEIAKH
ncbi:hypothetical protein ASPZODRAFT_74945 [Penicilliopsis zonata CBS 506.65]|uniref:Short-chain dehydrogenase/reductase family protein n=1 Tax=Penicilliopsis zonata CBS 506.65 TaxID=1073090 RepID=A0A1L9S7D7_9EURO|nr:hypothetical protein ASPZODRAFT_74945 [Penicilliopsis zonata CBS 506.65]OJJ43066.1 hypothetical protein ASPZODRAFT_74945 [Penicilliopsis zonata CBS 506.65]